MSTASLPFAATPLSSLQTRARDVHRSRYGTDSSPRCVVSPYRINPIGAHVDHQGGDVLARTIDQYTVLTFEPTDEAGVTLSTDASASSDSNVTSTSIALSDPDARPEDPSWVRYARGAVLALGGVATLKRGFRGHVSGTMIGAGLSSSASVILAYIEALATVNGVVLTAAERIELCRVVENQHLGLNNGLQDQMSVVHGRVGSLSRLHMASASAEQIPDSPQAAAAAWLLCYSGYSRELVSSGFNERVAECRSAARLLQDDAAYLGMVDPSRRHADARRVLPAALQRRVAHVYDEMARVQAGAEAWSAGDLAGFGHLMNASCQSSIQQYECGSQPMIDLQELALQVPGVFGSRFGGGGYGGCLILLVEADALEAIGQRMMEGYLARHPTKRGIARAVMARAEGSVRVCDLPT